MLKHFLLPLFFVSFLFADAAYSQISPDPPFRGDTAGVVNGRVLTRKAYIQMFSDITWQAPEKIHPLSEHERKDAHLKTWDALVVDAIIKDSIEKKGIIVTDAEVKSMLENYPPQVLVQQFTDSSGNFHKTDYLQALHSPQNDSIVRVLIFIAKPAKEKQKFEEILLARVPQVTDDELWEEYRRQENKSLREATRKNFEEEKKKLYAEKLNAKQQAFMSNWIESAKATAKIIDYRTIK